MASAVTLLREIAQSAGLPQVAITRSGVVFYPREDVWRFRDGLTDVNLAWQKLDAFPIDLIAGMKATMVWYAKNGSPASMQAYFKALEYWVEVNPSPKLTEQEFYRFRTLQTRTRTVGHVKSFLRKWMLDDVELGYAITVHKAQGSQWKRVIVPVAPTRMLDRTLLYTAMTRAQDQVILVGDVDAARKAAVAEPRANLRQVNLDLLLADVLKAQKSSTKTPATAVT